MRQLAAILLPAHARWKHAEGAHHLAHVVEIRIADDGWYLDSFVMSSTGSRTLMNRANHHPFGQWYHVAMVYDGREFRNYVNGVKENQGEVKLASVKQEPSAKLPMVSFG